MSNIGGMRVVRSSSGGGRAIWPSGETVLSTRIHAHCLATVATLLPSRPTQPHKECCVLGVFHWHSSGRRVPRCVYVQGGGVAGHGMQAVSNGDASLPRAWKRNAHPNDPVPPAGRVSGTIPGGALVSDACSDRNCVCPACPPCPAGPSAYVGPRVCCADGTGSPPSPPPSPQG